MSSNLQSPGGPQQIVFLGASASRSRAHALFPEWCGLLGAEASMTSVEMPLSGNDERYVDFVRGLAADERVLGCVITNHKVGIYRAFEELGFPLSAVSKDIEAVSVFRRCGSQFVGDAEEPRALHRPLDDICAARGSPLFSELIIFGGGGAGRALAYAASHRKHRHGFALMTLTDTNKGRAEDVRRLGARWATNFSIHHADTRAINDAIVARASDNALIVNATGLGKDLGGSPVSEAIRFPVGSAVWDFNYRGELDFLAQARGQAAGRSLSVHDGLSFFASGWLEALGYIFETQVSDDVSARFRVAAGGSM